MDELQRAVVIERVALAVRNAVNPVISVLAVAFSVISLVIFESPAAKVAGFISPYIAGWIGARSIAKRHKEAAMRLRSIYGGDFW